MAERATHEITVKGLKNEPISVLKTEIPALAKALGIDPSELLRIISPAGGEFASGDCRCCGNDSW